MLAYDPLVSVHWLAQNLERVRVIDGTWSMPGDKTVQAGGFIPGASVFDIDLIADPKSEMAHMLPTAETFARAVSKMGISPSDTVVIYDRHGVFSAPRVWWTFRIFGHENVRVLDGGLPAWTQATHTTAPAPSVFPASRYTVQKPLARAATLSEVLSALGAQTQIIDARPPGRFNGTTPEPRSGLASGHMPGAINIPFGSLRTPCMSFKPLDEIAQAFIGVDIDAPIITTCGSGITAAGLAFILARLGAAHVQVYDGSWTEYGAQPNVPIDRH